MTDEHPPPAHEATQPMATAPPAEPAGADEDSDPDFDDLDDVLDQFSASSAAAPPTASGAVAKSRSQPPPAASGPGRPDGDASTASSKLPATTDPSEEDFMANLKAEMTALIANMSHDPAAETTSPEQLGQMGRELEQFTERMEREGVKPEDLLRAILGEENAEKVVDKAAEIREQDGQERLDGKKRSASEGKREAEKKGSTSSSRDVKGTEGAIGTAGPNAAAFKDTIQQTIERMSTSDATATNATSQSANSEDDILAQLLKAMETTGGSADGGGEDGDLSKIFLGMMEQLTNKELLYEPMKELDDKFPDWLATKEKEGKLPQADMARFRNQRAIVREIVGKFEERGYSDEDPRCREFIWERMQRMQNEGSPPEDLIANPFPGMGGGMPGLPGLGGGGEGGEDAGCPTQ